MVSIGSKGGLANASRTCGKSQGGSRSLCGGNLNKAPLKTFEPQKVLTEHYVYLVFSEILGDMLKWN
jgi:hypothetical protein